MKKIIFSTAVCLFFTLAAAAQTQPAKSNQASPKKAVKKNTTKKKLPVKDAKLPLLTSDPELTDENRAATITNKPAAPKKTTTSTKTPH